MEDFGRSHFELEYGIKIDISSLQGYEKDKKELILKTIIKKIRLMNLPIDKQTRYLKQLLVLAKLRNLQRDTYNLIEQMPVILEHPITEDGVYKMGLEEGLERGRKEAFQKLKENIVSFLKLGTYSNQELADILGIEVSLVDEVEKGMRA